MPIVAYGAGMRLRRGLTLVELAVAVVILALGSLVAIRSLDQARRTLGGQGSRVLAQEVALNRAAELRLYGLQTGRDLPTRVRQGLVDWDLSLTEADTEGGRVQATIRISAEGQPGAVVLVHLADGGG